MEFNDYAKISVATDIVVLTTDDKQQVNNRKVAEKGLKVLLIKRDEEPYKGKWSLPGGFVNTDDTLIGCVKRKLREKTGLEDIYTEQLCTYGDNLHRDDRGRVVSVGYIALAPKEKIVLNSAEASKEAAWFWVRQTTDGMTNFMDFMKFGITMEAWEASGIVFESVDGLHGTVGDLAFDHKLIIVDAINRIKNKVMYTDVAFNLVNEQFTVKELQNVYELLLGKEIQGFRKLINDKIEELDIWTDGKAHRPARLFKKK